MRHVGWSTAIAVAISLMSQMGWTQTSPRPSIEADVVYGHKDGLAMTMDVYRPEGDFNGATILFVMSGGWHSSWAPPEQVRPLFQPYLDHGFCVLAVRHGSSPRYGIPDAVSDLREAVRYVHQHQRELALDAKRLGVMGMSAGGHLALMLGTTAEDSPSTPDGASQQASTRVAAVVALVPPTDLSVMVWSASESLPVYRNFAALDLPLEDAKRNSPLLHVTADDAPSLVFVGGKDELVPAKHGQWIEAAFEREQVPHQLIEFPDAGHGLEGAENQARVIRETIAWFDQHLVKETP